MTRFRTIGLVVVALMAAMAVAASAASAESFKVTAEAFPATVEGEQSGNQVFTTEAGTMTCTKDKIKGEAPEAQAEKATQEVKFTKANCSLVGKKPSNEPVGHFEFTDGNSEGNGGTVKILETTTVSFAGLCEVKVEPAGNTSLGEIKFANLAEGKLEVKAAVTGITYKLKNLDTGKKGCLGAADGTYTNGTYSGNNKVSVVGGTIKAF